MSGFPQITIFALLNLWQGENVSENEAIYHNFYQWKIVSSGRIQKVSVEMFVDSTDRPAGTLRDDNTKLLCKVEADVTHIPESQLTKRKGSDGEMYYDLECKLEAVCKLAPARNHRRIIDNEQTVRHRLLGPSSIRGNVTIL